MRKLFSRSVKSFSRDEKGATMVEYAIVVGVIAMIALFGASQFGGTLNGMFKNLSTTAGAVNTAKGTQ